MTIRVLSFDFDGCIFNKKYNREVKSKYKEAKNTTHGMFSRIQKTQELINSNTVQAAITSNQTLLDNIKKQNRKYSTVYTLIGSNRQSFLGDLANAYNKGTESCFPAIQKINDYLETTLDTILLPDIYHNLKPGTSYKRAISNINNSEARCTNDHVSWIFDGSKATLLYAQIHYIANKHPEEEIVYDFYDDTSDILNGLSTYYTNNTHLIPKNVTLNLHQYTGEDTEDLLTLQGKGDTHKNYTEIVKALGKEAEQYGSNDETLGYNIAKDSTPELLAIDFPETKKPLHTLLGVSEPTKQLFEQNLMTMIKKIHALRLTDKQYYSAKLHNNDPSDERQSAAYLSYKNASKSAIAVYKAIVNAYETLQDLTQFQETATNAIKEALESSLNEHRGGHSKKIFAYLSFTVGAILTLGISCVIHYALTRRLFPTVNTDSTNKLLALQKSIDNLITTNKSPEDEDTNNEDHDDDIQKPLSKN